MAAALDAARRCQRLRATADPGGFARLLRAELTKFRTVRAWMIGLGSAAVVFVLLSWLSAFASRAADGAVASGPGGEPVADSYMYVHQALVGDGSLTARITSLRGDYSPLPGTVRYGLGTSSYGGVGGQLRAGLAPWAKAGILVEPDTRQGAAYAAVMVTGAHGVRMQDNYTGDKAGLAGTVLAGSGGSAPRWLRLTRAGDIVIGYDSADGARWTEVSAVRLAGLPRTVDIGLFVTSPVYLAGGQGVPSRATATFDQVSARGLLLPGSWTPGAVAGFYPTLPSSWQQRSGNAFTISGSGDIAPLVGDIVSTHWSGASVVNGTIAALLVVIVLAALFVTTEYRRGLIRTTFAASPRRSRVIAAKAVVVGSLAFAAGAVAAVLAELITRHVFAVNGNYLFPQSAPALARVVIGTGLFLGLAAVLVVGLGAMLRRSVATVAASFVLLVVPGILGSQSGNWLMRFSPTAAFAVQATLPRSRLVSSIYTPPNGYFPISPWAGLAVLAAYAFVALALAAWLVRRRDV